MKKLIACAFAILLAFALCAVAEDESNVIYDAGTVRTYDFDYDGMIDTMLLYTNLDEYYDGSFTFSVNGNSYTFDNCIYLNPTVYAMRCNWYSTLFMVCEYGPSDDPVTYCFLYDCGELSYIGNIYASAENFTVNADGLITTQVRADMLGTWFRPADFKIAYGYHFDNMSGDFIPYRYICEVPRDIYPMGMIVTLKRDLPLYASRYDKDPSLTLKANSIVILAASDNARWLYVTDTANVNRGWVMMARADYTDYIFVGSRGYSADEVFDDILYAD